MERTLSVEEKIRRAEEIYERRHSGEVRPTATLNVNNDGKKDIKLLKKLILQIVACLLIYLIVYTVQNNNYIFSDDFINKAKEILSYDTNFMQIYDNTKNGVMAFFNSNSSQETNNTNENENQNDNNDVNQNSLTNNLESKSNNQNIGGSNENEQTANQSKENENTSTSEAKPLSEEEQMILNVKNTTSFIKPIEGTITSGYGQREVSKATIPKNHTGTDIAANLGTKIKAATDGEVVIASSEGDYGNHLKIEIGEVSVVYAHCNSLYVKQGDKVVQGQEIAEVGSTGNSTGPHLHFEIRFLEKTIDPQKILDL